MGIQERRAGPALQPLAAGAATAPHAPPASATPAPARSGLQGRWIVCGLLFAATALNYMDRQVIGILKPTLQSALHWSEIDYSNIVLFFQLAYAVGYAVAGRLMDLLGTRFGLAGAVLFWSLAAASHGLARSVTGFSLARAALGLGEGGNFPASIKTVGEWFPQRDRALATGLFNSGSNIGALIAPILVPFLTVQYGWQMAFYVTGALGLVWLAFWLAIYRTPPRTQATGADASAKRLSWLQLLARRATWAFVVGTLLTSPVWWFYLFWVPDFLHRAHHLNITAMGPPLVAIYLLTDTGSIAGGWLSSMLIKRGWRPLNARKIALLACAACVIPVFLAPQTGSLWGATLLIALAAAAHQGLSANLYTLVSDTTPSASVASVVGIGGMAGAIGGMFVAKVVGFVLQGTGSYVVLFAGASAAYPLAVLLMHLILPRARPAEPV
jgi:MFS transporter, ACS family, aldohexuronate transporter